MRLAITCFLIWSLTFTPAFAWNAAGHKIIASIAFRQLTAGDQAKVVAMLKKHPRFTEDFANEMPEDIRNGGEAAENEWLFQQSAIWADTIRSGSKDKTAYHRSEW